MEASAGKMAVRSYSVKTAILEWVGFIKTGSEDYL